MLRTKKIYPKFRLPVVLFLTVLLSFLSAVNSEVNAASGKLYAIVHSLPSSSNNRLNVVEISPETGNLRPIYSFSDTSVGITSITFDLRRNRYYGVMRRNLPNASAYIAEVDLLNRSFKRRSDSADVPIQMRYHHLRDRYYGFRHNSVNGLEEYNPVTNSSRLFKSDSGLPSGTPTYLTAVDTVKDKFLYVLADPVANNSDIVSVDLNNPSNTKRVTVSGLNILVHFDYDPVRHKFYAISNRSYDFSGSSTFVKEPNHLVEVDPDTGLFKKIVSVGGGVLPPHGTSFELYSGVLNYVDNLYYLVKIIFTAVGQRTNLLTVDLDKGSIVNEVTLNQWVWGLAFLPGQSIFVDWDSNVSADFNIYNNAPPGSPLDLRHKTVLDRSDGVLGNNIQPVVTGLSNNFKQMVEGHLQQILQASDMDEIKTFSTLNGENLPMNGISVRFAPALKYDSNNDGVGDVPYGLLGQAFDIVPDMSPEKIDRFNLRGGGETAVFIASTSTNAANTELIAETVAHEVGHGLGLRHINPDGFCNPKVSPCSPAQSKSVMDYDRFSPDVEEFYDAVTPNCEPPTNSPCYSPAGTHNPRYHLARYSLGQSKGAVTPPSLTAGTWDEGVITVSNVTFNSINLDGPIYQLAVIPYFPKGPGDVVNDISDIDILDDDTRSFDIPSYQKFSISATSTKESFTFDLYFIQGDISSPELVFDPSVPQEYQGKIVQYVQNTDSYIEVGDYSLAIRQLPASSFDDKLQVDIREIKFGEVDVGDSKQFELEVWNVAEDFLTPQCQIDSPFSVSGCDEMIPPHESIKLIVEYAPVENVKSNGYLTISSLEPEGGHVYVSLSGDSSITEVLEGDLDSDGDIDLEDVRLITTARNQPATGPDDPRDLDKDGRITALDARKLTLLCTRPRCSVE